MYLPVYANGVPTQTIGQRRAALQGFVYSPFRTKDLMAGILPHGTPEIDFEIFDGAALTKDRLLFATETALDITPVAEPAAYSKVQSIELPGQQWNDLAPSSRTRC